VTYDRKAYISGLRDLADLLDDYPDLPLPYDGTASRLTIFTSTKAELQAYARLIPGTLDKETSDGPYGFALTGALDGLRLRIYGKRAEVCERVVTGTREVTVSEPDPEAVAVLPLITRTETVEDVTRLHVAGLLDRPGVPGRGGRMITWMSQQDAAEYLGMTVKTLHRYIANGSLTAYRVGGRVIRLHARDLEAFATQSPIEVDA
jgi:excisionase family DNA binding protein